MRLWVLVLGLLLAGPAVAGDSGETDGAGVAAEVGLDASWLPSEAPTQSAEGQASTLKKPPYGVGGWAHFGGGVGAMIGARRVHPTGRVDVGFGGYLFLVYGGIAANVTFSSHLDFVLTGVGYAGLAIPIPVVRPLIGFKFGGGLHQDAEWGPSPAIQLGPQIGVHIGQIGGSRFGIRVMVDAEAIVSTEHRAAGFGIIGSVALML